MLFLVTLATEKTGCSGQTWTGGHPAKAKVPFDRLSSWVQRTPIKGTTVISLHILQHMATKALCWGVFLFYVNITLNVSTYKLLLSLTIHILEL